MTNRETVVNVRPMGATAQDVMIWDAFYCGMASEPGDVFGLDPRAVYVPGMRQNTVEFDAKMNRSATLARYIASIEGEPVGMIGCSVFDSVDGSYGGIGDFYVASGSRGMGVGTALFRCAIGFLEPKVKQVDLLVSSENKKAKEYYKKLGFVMVMNGICSRTWWDGSTEVYDSRMSACTTEVQENMSGYPERTTS